jgi:hypothetical protein
MKKQPLLASSSLFLLATLSLTVTTTVQVIYAQQSEHPEQLPSESSTVAECSATMTHQSESAPDVNHANGPAQGCFTVREFQVDPEGSDCSLPEPVPGSESHASTSTGGSAHFNCGHPSETHP